MDPTKLAQQIDAHQVWVESRRVEGAQAVFQGIDLRFVSLAGRRLNESVFAESNLERADLRGVMFAGADLRKVNMAYADLSGADLSGANLSGARLEGAMINNANLREALMEGAIFDSASLKSANFTGARGSRARFNLADMSSAELDAAVFQEAQFNGTNLTQASLRETTLDRAQMRGALLSGAQFDGTSLRDALLHGAILVGVSFDTSNVEGARIDRNALGGAGPGADEDDDGDFKPIVKSPGSGVFSGGVLAPNAQMAALLRRRDELQPLIFKRLLPSKSRGEKGGVEDAGLAALRTQLDVVESDRRLLRQDIRRQEQHRREAQVELQNRVDAATLALKSALSFTKQQMQQSFVWSLVAKGAGLSLVGLSAIWLLVCMARLLGGASTGLGEWLVLAAGLLGAGLALLLIDHFGQRSRRPLVIQHDRIENVIAALHASLHLSVDVETNQANILATFEAAKKVLLATSAASPNEDIV